MQRLEGWTMKRLAVISIVVASVSLSIGSATQAASAAPAPSTSITLTCDKGVDASVLLTLHPSETDTSSLGQITIACGPNSNVGRQRNRVDVPTGATQAGWVSIQRWTNSTGVVPTGCSVGGLVTFKDSCTNEADIGSELVVR